MADVLLVKRPVQLTVYDFDYYFEEKREQIRETLIQLSGLHIKVRRSTLFHRKFYAYFDSVDSANAAALAVVKIDYCQTSICIGTFDVTDLVKYNNEVDLKYLRLQPRDFFKPKIVKEMNYAINMNKEF